MTFRHIRITYVVHTLNGEIHKGSSAECTRAGCNGNQPKKKSGPMGPRADYAKRLKRKMRSARMRVEELADRLGVDPSVVSRWRCAGGLPDRQTRERIEKILFRARSNQDG